MRGLTLNRVFVLSLIGLLAGLGLLFWLVIHGLQTALLSSAMESRDKNSAVIGQSVTNYLRQAPEAISDFEGLIKVGILKPSEALSLRSGLMAVLLNNKEISEATFIFAKRSGFDANGFSIIDPATVGQVTLYRGKTRAEGFVHQVTWYDGGRFLSTRAHLYVNGRETNAEAPVPAVDPAAHLTFKTPAQSTHQNQLLWTDLHWSGVDGILPESRRRVEVSVLKAIDYPAGQFAGVLRIGLFKDAIDATVARPPPSVDLKTHSIFLCDNEGKLIALSGSTHYVTIDGDVRVSPDDAPPQVEAALARPLLREVSAARPVISDQFVLSGTAFLCTFRRLPHTQDWVLGMAVPRRAYLKALVKTWRRVLWGSLILAGAIAVFGGIVLHGVSVAHSIIVREAGRMNDFVLDPSKNTSRLRDVDHVLTSLERAKTAMRSMGKYVPLDLVRRLYHRGEEPSLGGEATELSVLFSDIQGFTTFAESKDGDTVAARLGEYLHVMVTVIQQEKGTIDKFIGDSVMAFWNAPEAVPGHPALACRAALACREALLELYATPEWNGLPGFRTRFGLHHCVASVGHFGSPERFNYTAIGDGINLASRLESLNKHYGTDIIVSASFSAAAGPGFQFRQLDRVAVKGKTECLDIHELLGQSGAPFPPCIAAYEGALAAWFEGDFPRALAIAEAYPADPPSAYLARRCRKFIASPPKSWKGVYTFESK